MLSALSCCAQGSAFESRELMPCTPASCTQGWLVWMSPPLTRHKSCQLCAMAVRLDCAMRFAMVSLELRLALAAQAGGAVTSRLQKSVSKAHCPHTELYSHVQSF